MRALFTATPAILLLSVSGWAQTIHIQAIRVSDDDGKRPARVTPAQFRQWVDFANRCYGPAGIKFLFSQDEGDFGSLKCTAINNMVGAADEAEANRVGERIGTQFPDKLVVFCRHGPGEKPTGQAFSSQHYHFVVMPGFSDAITCGHISIDGLAHEIGHYLGLPHIFPRVFADIAAAEAHLKAHGNDPSCFDNDGLDDTAPDPYVRSFGCDRSVTSVVLNGMTFELPRRNIMSYYDERDGLSTKQMARARWYLGIRMRHGMGRPRNTGATSPIEAETLKVVDRRNCSESVQDMSSWGGTEAWSGGKQLFCSGGENGTMTFLLPVKAEIHARLNVYLTQSWDFGKIQAYLDDKSIGDVFDAYSPFVNASGCVPLGTVDLSEGDHRLRFDAVGKNEASKGFKFGIDCVELSSSER